MILIGSSPTSAPIVLVVVLLAGSMILAVTLSVSIVMNPSPLRNQFPQRSPLAWRMVPVAGATLVARVGLDVTLTATAST
jgi:hypothetical protein